MSIGELLSGQQLGKYRLRGLLGQGNYSEVYLGEHIEPGNPPVAIKLLSDQLEELEVKRFLTQAAILDRMEHPHLVHIYDFGRIDGGTPYLIMSYAPNGTMRQRFPRGTVLPLNEVVSYARQIASALHYVHEHQLVHRDVKPQNMLLDADNKIILSDFGTATISYSFAPNVMDFEGTVLYA